ncbi:uncharacterized protein [Primulina huaijiensis]|uniref:uncharacterized protein n=1 Tax=Primulina huaijiensis TaxID=1492673 RepID=UPI003CC71005
MGKIGTKMPNFCLNRIRPLVRVRSPPVQSKSQESETDQDNKDDPGSGVEKSGAVNGRRIMIVVDSSMEAKHAVQWALSHTVQSQDIIILFYVTKPSNQGDRPSKKEVINPRIPEFLSGMKSMCQLKMPEVHVEVAVVEGREKGPTIVAEAKKQGVALMVLGQKKRSVTWRLMSMWAGKRVPASGLAEYCVQNAGCMALAVRRKSKKLGGYLITTKRQKDFWLLA